MTGGPRSRSEDVSAPTFLRYRMQDIRRIFAERLGQDAPTIVSQAPGRVNLIGEHTDYNNGFVLPMAIDRWTEVAVSPRDDQTVRAYSSVFDEFVTFEMPPDAPPRSGGWRDYVVGVVTMLARRGSLGNGFDLAIGGDVPLGGGLSSSAALEVSLALALVQMYGIEMSDVALVQLCQEAEHAFVGTHCGIMDQYVALMARKGTALLLDVAALDHRYVPLALDGVTLLTVDSGVRRSLAQSAYNVRRQECQDAVRWLQAALAEPTIRSLRDVREEDLKRVQHAMPTVLHRRAWHVVTENARVLQAVDALEDHDAARFGALLSASHRSLRDAYEVSVPELDFLVSWGEDHEGLGARLIGGGFGGATLHVVPAQEADAYAEGITRAYAAAWNQEATVARYRPGPGAKQLLSRGGG